MYRPMFSGYLEKMYSITFHNSFTYFKPEPEVKAIHGLTGSNLQVLEKQVVQFLVDHPFP